MISCYFVYAFYCMYQTWRQLALSNENKVASISEIFLVHKLYKIKQWDPSGSDNYLKTKKMMFFHGLSGHLQLFDREHCFSYIMMIPQRSKMFCQQWDQNSIVKQPNFVNHTCQLASHSHIKVFGKWLFTAITCFCFSNKLHGIKSNFRLSLPPPHKSAYLFFKIRFEC